MAKNEVSKGPNELVALLVPAQLQLHKRMDLLSLHGGLFLPSRQFLLSFLVDFVFLNSMLPLEVLFKEHQQIET